MQLSLGDSSSNCYPYKRTEKKGQRSVLNKTIYQVWPKRPVTVRRQQQLQLLRQQHPHSEHSNTCVCLLQQSNKATATATSTEQQQHQQHRKVLGQWPGIFEVFRAKFTNGTGATSSADWATKTRVRNICHKWSYQPNGSSSI